MLRNLSTVSAILQRPLFASVRHPVVAANTKFASRRQEGIRCLSSSSIDKQATADLFGKFAQKRNGVWSLNCDDLRLLLKDLGETPNPSKINRLFDVADSDHNGLIDQGEFMDHCELFLGDNPARILLVIGGPGSGKGLLCSKLEEFCDCVHLSSGELLRAEVAAETPLGKSIKDTMDRGELVRSAVLVRLMKQRLKDHPGKRVVLDGFPRSLENARDLVQLCGTPELVLHLVCDDTILLERLLLRKRHDDTLTTIIHRLRTYHRFQPMIMEWLKEQHVPTIRLDGCGTPDHVWEQLTSIGRLMRGAVQLRGI